MKTSNVRKSKIGFGVVLLTTGLLLFFKNLGASIPEWIFSWPMVLILIGIISGVRHDFKKPGAFIIILIGIVFLTDSFLTGVQLHELLFPLLVTAAGIYMLLKRNDRFHTAENTGNTIEK